MELDLTNGKKKILNVNTTTIKGKRWALKKLLESVGVMKTGETYSFDRGQVIGKKLIVKVAIKKNQYISNRTGEPIENIKNEVTDFTSTNGIESIDNLNKEMSNDAITPF
jgi:hypothetical protein